MGDIKMSAGSVLVGVGAIAFIGSLIWLIVRSINWDSKIPPVLGMLLCLVMVVCGVSVMDETESPTNSDVKSKSEDKQDQLKTEDANIADDSSDTTQGDSVVISNLATEGYLFLDDDVLYKYGEYLIGQNVVTVITIKDISGSTLKADTAGNDSYFYSINCEFGSKDDLAGLEEGGLATVAGTVKDGGGIASTVVLENCRLIGLGEIQEELQSGADEQRASCEQLKQEYEQAVAAEIKAEKDTYISECQVISYEKIERNPDSYKGTKIKISGKVVQVAEGWFDTVTMRIDCNGNMWYVTYSREDGESRILEGDSITAYGECDGVRSYTSVLGSQVTIPSMSMKYYT